MSFVVMAEFEIKPGRGDDFADYIKWHAQESLKEDGCQLFKANRDNTDPQRFVMYEIYDDEASLAAHRETPHYARFVNEIIPDQLVMHDDTPFVFRRAFSLVNE